MNGREFRWISEENTKFIVLLIAYISTWYCEIGDPLWPVLLVLFIMEKDRTLGQPSPTSSTLSNVSSVSDLPPTPIFDDLLGGSSITATKLNGSSNYLQRSASIATFLLP